MRLGAVVPAARARLVALVAPLATRAVTLARSLIRRPVALISVAVAIGVAAILALVLILARAASGGSPGDARSRQGERVEAASGPAAGRAESVSRRGGPQEFAMVPSDTRELAGMLVIPGLDDWPYPLALVPKPRYTEADADGLWPDFGSMDLSELSRRRKAELEAILDAVD